jgi:CBS domain-containing membrane protein
MTDLTVRDLMSRDVIAARLRDSVSSVRQLMWENGFRHMPVVDDAGRLAGLISQRDLLRFALAHPQGSKAKGPDDAERLLAADVMTESVDTVAPDVDIRDAANHMFYKKLGCLPVIEQDRLVGILTESDFVRFLAHGD